jgi:hypothetical protein
MFCANPRGARGSPSARARRGEVKRHHAGKQGSFSRRTHAPELCPQPRRHFQRQACSRKEGSKAPKGACQSFRASLEALRPVGTGAAARQFGARPPSGALLRHSPGRTHPPLAQLQFPRFLRPDLTGVTRFDLSRVYRAPRRPVVMPVERWPRAARERMANPPAGTAPAPLFRLAFRKGALHERGGGNVT